MKNLQLRLSTVHTVATLGILLLLSPLVLFAQAGSTTALTAEQVVGSYKAKLTGPPSGDVTFTMVIKSDKGKLSGHLVGPRGEHPFSSSEIAGSKLTVKLGSGAEMATLVLQLRDGNLVGDWTEAGKTKPVEFKKVVTEAAAADAKKPATEPSAAEALSGEWDAAADVQGQAFPFELNLKVEGEKVTGTSSSQLGNSTVSSGSWKDGKLALVIDNPNGQIALIATMVDGKLVGDFDYGGQLSGKWVAAKKKP